MLKMDAMRNTRVIFGSRAFQGLFIAELPKKVILGLFSDKTVTFNDAINLPTERKYLLLSLSGRKKTFRLICFHITHRIDI